MFFDFSRGNFKKMKKKSNFFNTFRQREVLTWNEGENNFLIIVKTPLDK